MTDNAKPKSTPCEGNVWYRMATIHSMQDGDNIILDSDMKPAMQSNTIC